MRKAAVVLALGLALAACGGDGDKKAKAPTKAEWTEKADKICADAQAKVDALGPVPIGDLTKLPDWAKNGVAIRTQQIEDLKGLEEPTETKTAIDASLAKATALLEQAKTSLGSGSAPATLVGSLTELQIKQQEVQKELAAHGPSKCAPK